MDSRITHPDHGHNYDHDPHNAALHPVAQGEDEHAHERKSVMKKVKAKAKKIKDTLKKHGHGHDHEHDHDHDYQRAGHHIPDDHDLDEEDDEDEETVEDTEVHGVSEERYVTKISEPITLSHSQGVYGTKATDPTGTGGEVAGITPILQSFVKMNVHDEPDPKSAGVADHNLPISTGNQFTNLPTGSHDQFSPEPVPPEPEAKAFRDKPQLPESFTTKLENCPHDDISGKPSNQSSYAEKISSAATSAIADKAISASNVVASKLGYGEKDDTTRNEDKGGVVSVKDYVLEKLKPGDEDRALSELISDALHKQRRPEEPEKAKMRPVGKVTESKEVASRLGTKDENYGKRTQSSYLDSQGTGVVDKLKGAVGSWFRLRGESQSQVPQQPHGDHEGI